MFSSLFTGLSAATGLAAGEDSFAAGPVSSSAGGGNVITFGSAGISNGVLIAAIVAAGIVGFLYIRK